MFDYYASISLDLLRDYLLFLFSILLLAVVVGLYIGIKNYASTRRIEQRMLTLHHADKKDFVRELSHIEDLYSTKDNFGSYFGALSKVLDLYAVSLTDKKGEVQYVNELFCKQTGYRPDELLGKTHKKLSSFTHSQSFWNDMYRCIQSDRIWHNVIKNKRKNGTFYWADTTIIPLSMFSRLEGFLALRTDVTDIFLQKDSLQEELHKKISQLKGAEKIMEKTDKMATLGTLVAGIAHEINNPMSYVSSNMSSLDLYMIKFSDLIGKLSSCDLEKTNAAEYLAELQQKIHAHKINFAAEEASAIIQETNDGIKRIRQIILDLKLYSHASNEKFVQTDINQCINRVTTIVNSELKHRIKLNLSLGNIPPIYCIENKIQQVILNLIINASQAIDNIGDISISTALENDQWIRISIMDTGIGIPEENLANIFQPFFTTKPPGEGTGLGLAISNGIIQAHDGTIDCNSQYNKGTEFVIRLPLKTTMPDDQEQSPWEVSQQI